MAQQEPEPSDQAAEVAANGGEDGIGGVAASEPEDNCGIMAQTPQDKMARPGHFFGMPHAEIKSKQAVFTPSFTPNWPGS